MPKASAAKTSQRGSGRAGVVKNVTFELEAWAIVQKNCPPGRKGTSKFVMRLIYEFDARQDERRRLFQQDLAAMTVEEEEL